MGVFWYKSHITDDNITGVLEEEEEEKKNADKHYYKLKID